MGLTPTPAQSGGEVRLGRKVLEMLLGIALGRISAGLWDAPGPSTGWRGWLRTCLAPRSPNVSLSSSPSPGAVHAGGLQLCPPSCGSHLAATLSPKPCKIRRPP